MKFAHYLGKINSWILLTIMYFIAVGVYAIVLRIIKILVWPFKKRDVETYWIERKESFDPESFKYPF